MLKVWSDGLDVVVARDLGQVPSVLDRHYRVTGHTLRHTTWREVPHSQTLRLHRENSVQQVEACALASSPDGAGWVGRLAAAMGSSLQKRSPVGG